MATDKPFDLGIAVNKVGVLIIGAKGAVSTTLIAAHCAAKQKLGFDFALPSQAEPLYQQLSLLALDDIAFGGWDIHDDTYSDSCRLHKVIPDPIIDDIQDNLNACADYPAIMAEFDTVMDDLKQRDDNKQEAFQKHPLTYLVSKIQSNIEDFKERENLSKVMVVNLASTEKTLPLNEEHETLDAFEAALEVNSPTISNGMLYAYASLKQGCCFINFTPSATTDIPALLTLASQQKVAVAGKDGKSGQTLYKTAVAPLFKHRGLKIDGWYSTNILGNRDGQVLNNPDNCETKIISKSAVLDNILGYSDFDHQVHIHYYKPRGDAKEAWDNIDFSGWFNKKMQMKINWLGDDSILAAPLVFDLIRWTAFFHDNGESGELSQLATYFKSPQGTDKHDFFQQTDLLKQHILTHYCQPDQNA